MNLGDNTHTLTINKTCERREMVHTVEVVGGVVRVVEVEVGQRREGSVIVPRCFRRGGRDCDRGRRRKVFDVVLEKLNAVT